MKEEFTNASGDYIAFTDDGITCKNTVKNRFYPYGSIDKIGFSLGSLDVLGKANGENKGFIYAASDKEQKKRLKELVVFAKSKMKTAARTEVVEIEPKKTQEQAEAEYRAHLKEKREAEYAELNKEIRMKCNVCGHIFCYTKKELNENTLNAGLTALSAIGQIAASVGGSRYDMYETRKATDSMSGKLVDYSKCPNCGSHDLREMTKEETEESSSAASASNAVSAADELKKFKELLDMGVITQEEFDAKKKQLLGL